MLLSFRGASETSEPGISRHDFWIPGSLLREAPEHDFRFYFFPACARRRSSCSRSSGVSASPKSSAEKTCRISISSPLPNGARFIQPIASSSDLVLISQNPAIRSPVSSNGPRLSAFCPVEYLIRAPLDVGCRPSPASMTPALAISSLNLPIAVSNSVLGITPASLSLLAFTITINRIVSLRLILIAPRGYPPALINKTNRVLRHRHVLRNYFGGNCQHLGSTAQPTMWLGASSRES